LLFSFLLCRFIFKFKLTILELILIQLVATLTRLIKFFILYLYFISELFQLPKNICISFSRQ